MTKTNDNEQLSAGVGCFAVVAWLIGFISLVVLTFGYSPFQVSWQRTLTVLALVAYVANFAVGLGRASKK